MICRAFFLQTITNERNMSTAIDRSNDVVVGSTDAYGTVVVRKPWSNAFDPTTDSAKRNVRGINVTNIALSFV